jgi:hypothetical protein
MVRSLPLMPLASFATGGAGARPEHSLADLATFERSPGCWSTGAPTGPCTAPLWRYGCILTELKVFSGGLPKEPFRMTILLLGDHVLVREALRGVLKELNEDATVLEASEQPTKFDLVINL